MIRRFFVFFVFVFLLLLYFPGTIIAFQGSGQASPIPWSGYWWPFAYGGLATGADYRGYPAPLEKYLLLTTGHKTGLAIDWYKDQYYDPDAEPWWGLCPAYARAAVTEAYSILPSSHDNIIFRIGDKKGLLTLCHDDRSGVIYASGKTPVDFHFWLLDYIGAQQKGFAADMEAGTEVWYHPIFSYEMESWQSAQTEHVSVTVLYADDKVPPDYMGTRQRQKQYTYDLYLDAEESITGGNWTGNSISDHPETLSFPEVNGSLNPYLDCEKIQEIARAQDDFLEMPDNASARLLPGTYNLVLLNEDAYMIQGAPGDEAMLEITRQDGSSQSMHIEIIDNDDIVVDEDTLSLSGSSVRFRLALENPSYRVVITQDDYESDPNIYSLVMDFHGAHVRQVPYIPKNGSWIGFSLTNGFDDQVAEVMLVTCDTDRQPLHTVDGPRGLLPGEKYLINFSNLPVRKHDYPHTDSLMLISDYPVDVVNLFATAAGPMAGFSSAAPTGSRLILPDVHDNEPWDSLYMTGAVTNESFEDADITCFVYSDKGALMRTVSQNIAARGKFLVRPGSSPFHSVPDGGWMEIIADDPEAVLTGYQYLRNTDNPTNTLDTAFAQPVASDIMYVQHVTHASGPWRTLLTLINPNADDNLVIIHPSHSSGDSAADMQVAMAPFEKQVIDLSSDFGELFQAEIRSMFEISGDYPLSGYVTYAADNGDAASYPLLDSKKLKTELIMPHAAYNNRRWYTGVGVCNPNTYPVTVLILPYDQNGPMSAAVEYLDLAPGSYDVFTVYRMFPGLAAEIAFLKIRSLKPDIAKIGGFYLYCNSSARNLKPRTLVSGGNM